MNVSLEQKKQQEKELLFQKLQEDLTCQQKEQEMITQKRQEEFLIQRKFILEKNSKLTAVTTDQNVSTYDIPGSTSSILAADMEKQTRYENDSNFFVSSFSIAI